jgi:hypothetical protein
VARGKLAWELADAHESGMLTLSLPLTGAQARSLLRDQAVDLVLPSPRRNEPGNIGDLVSTGWPGLYAVSDRVVDALQGFTGWRIRAFPKSPAWSFAGVLCVSGSCGPVDYSKSTQIRQMGDFLRLRGLGIDSAAWDGSDMAVPDNREVVLITERVASRLRGMVNIQLTEIESVEFDISAKLLAPKT